MSLPDSARQLSELDVRSAADAQLDGPTFRAIAHLVPSWQSIDGQLTRSFEFANYHQTMDFANAVAAIAHSGDHHPQMTVEYRRCVVRWSTHSAGGLTLKDLICAAQVDLLQCLKKG